jgi:hypothetical protein
MRITLAETEAEAPRRAGPMTWLRRGFDMVVIGAMVLALVETISFLRGLFG